MLPRPKKHEIDHRTIKLLVGIVALTLAPLTNQFAEGSLESISESYWKGGSSQTIFIGFTFAVAAFLMAYNGFSTREMVASKIAATGALLVAWFPCECGTHTDQMPYVHWIAASVMFLALAYLCFVFRQRAREKRYPQAALRAHIYAGCGVAILASIVVLALDHLTGKALSARFQTLTFWGEALALFAFGLSWLVASRVLPFITKPEERFSPLADQNPVLD